MREEIIEKVATIRSDLDNHLRDCEHKRDNTDKILEKILEELRLHREYSIQQKTTIAIFKWLAGLGGGAGMIAFIQAVIFSG